jgi:hypothetical protein
VVAEIAVLEGYEDVGPAGSRCGRTSCCALCFRGTSRPHEGANNKIVGMSERPPPSHVRRTQPHKLTGGHHGY